MPEFVRSITVDIVVDTNKATQRDRLQPDEDEGRARFVGRVSDALVRLGAFSGAASSETEHRFMQMARLVAESWGMQDGVSGVHLDDLAEIYRTLIKEEQGHD